MSVSNTKVGSSGPELRGGNITLETILRPTDVTLRQTKIICTLGPACWDVPTLESLIDAGLAVARFNFSHGDHEGHQACLERLRTAAKNKNKHIGTLNVECDVRYVLICESIVDCTSNDVRAYFVVFLLYTTGSSVLPSRVFILLFVLTKRDLFDFSLVLFCGCIAIPQTHITIHTNAICKQLSCWTPRAPKSDPDFLQMTPRKLI